MTDRKCCHCKKVEDHTLNEKNKVKVGLRPYGPDGALVCFTCAFATPERRAQTEAQFKKALDGIDGPAVFTPNGPAPLIQLKCRKN